MGAVDSLARSDLLRDLAVAVAIAVAARHNGEDAATQLEDTAVVSHK